MSSPTVFTIPAGVPFLPTLADALLDGRFGIIDPNNPLALADATILLPTRRAARSLREILVDRSKSRATVLPAIRPIGDIDEEEHILAVGTGRAADAIALPPSIPPLDRLMTLATMILAWSGAASRAAPTTFQQDTIPATAADAMRLAADLARLIDDMATAGIAWDALDRLAPDEHAGYWQMTLEFLSIAGSQWPQFLTEQGRADPVERRNRLIRAEADRLGNTPPRGPIVAAGSTGSVPATAALLKAIARAENGAVVLPGLDQALEDDAWDAIGDAADPGTGAPSHPQFGLKRLLAEIGIVREDVVPLGEADALAANRSMLVNRALRPAETTDNWSRAPEPEADLLTDIALIEARNEQDEALAIATALREALEQPDATAALVTPDRSLAERVAVDLRRWRVAVDDSAGTPLDRTPNGTFVRLVSEVAFHNDVVALLALAKHPFARFGQPRARCRRAAKVLELVALRGPGAPKELRLLPEWLSNVRLAAEMRSGPVTPGARRRLGRYDWGEAEKLAKRIADAFAPLQTQARSRSIAVGETTRQIAAAIGLVAGEDEAQRSELWSDRVGEALSDLLAHLGSADRISIPPNEYPGFLVATMASVVVAPEPIGDPRIHIWGTLEARLQSVDLLILGGLDEGVWPGQIRTDPWLSRRMRTEVGLPPPERRIGLAAHDFAQAMAAPRVIVTRADRRGGAPTVPSRWLQRFEAVIGESHLATLRARGARYLALARSLDAIAPGDVRPVTRPAPTPPLDARPKELSVTSVETLIRDPYAVYARRVLRLEPLDQIGQRADARIRGSLIHEAFADFTRQWRGPFDRSARERFLEHWRSHFEAIADYPEVHAVWLLRAEPIADWLIAWEAGRDSSIAERHAEKAGDLTLEISGEPFTLKARADRIDVFKDGSIGIYDYKTGILATPKQVLLFQPQLALEGAMARRGAFGRAFADRPLTELAWIGLARVGKSEPLNSAVDDDHSPDSLAAESLTRLTGLIAAFRDPAKGYVSQAKPMFERRFPGDYDHLARVSEWRFSIEGAR